MGSTQDSTAQDSTAQDSTALAARPSALALAAGAIVATARRPLALGLCATLLLVSQLVLRAGLSPLLEGALRALLGTRPPVTTVATAALALLIGALFATAALLCGLAPASEARRAAGRDEGDAWCGLAGLAATPAALAALVTCGAAVAAITAAAAAAVLHVGGLDLAAFWRALALALVLAPALISLAVVATVAPLAHAWLAAGDLDGESLTDGFSAVGRALLAVTRDPAWSLSVAAALGLVCLPLQLLALVALPCWIADPPVAFPLHAIQCLALAGWSIGAGVGARAAFPCSRS